MIFVIATLIIILLFIIKFWMKSKEFTSLPRCIIFSISLSFLAFMFIVSISSSISGGYKLSKTERVYSIEKPFTIYLVDDAYKLYQKENGFLKEREMLVPISFDTNLRSFGELKTFVPRQRIRWLSMRLFIYRQILYIPRNTIIKEIKK